MLYNTNFINLFSFDSKHRKYILVLYGWVSQTHRQTADCMSRTIRFIITCSTVYMTKMNKLICKLGSQVGGKLWNRRCKYLQNLQTPMKYNTS